LPGEPGRVRALASAIELADGEIRLVRWPADLRELRSDKSGELDPEKRILASESLETITAAVAEPPAEAKIVEHRHAAPKVAAD
jgi:hypothetical protein